MNELNSEPILSVVIPTHNRQKYAERCIKAILENTRNVEIVVSDTSDLESLNLIFEPEILSGKVRYIRPAKGIDVVSNFEIAYESANGQYLTFIGDDDCIGPNIEEVVKWAQINKVDSFSSSKPADYYWPDFNSKYSNTKFSESLIIKPFSGKFKKINGKEELNIALKNLGEGVFNMPRAYMGIVSSQLCKEIKRKYGSLFGGVSPDIYSAALISYEAKKSVYVDYPILLPGSSGVSTAGQSANGKHKGVLRENAHISPFLNLIWNPLVPEFYSVPTVWAFSLIEAVNKINDSTLLPNYANLYSNCLLWHSDYNSEITKSMEGFFGKKQAPSKLIQMTQSHLWILCKTLYKVFFKIKNRIFTSNLEQIKPTKNIEFAFKGLKEKVEQRNIEHFYDNNMK